MKQLVIFLGILIGLGMPLGAQMHKADYLFDRYAFSKTIEKYEKQFNKGGESGREASGKLAEAWYRMGCPESAAPWFDRAVKEPDCRPELFLWYGQVLRNLEKYDRAGLYLAKYNSAVPEDHLGALLLESIRRKAELPDCTADYDIERPQGLNSENADFSPVYYRDGLLFSSEIRTNMMEKKVYPWTGRPYLNIFYAPLYISGNGFPGAGDVELFAPQLRSNWHDGTPTISQDGNTILWTRTIDKKAGRKEELPTHHLRIFSAQKSKYGWGEIQEFEYNSRDYSTGHPVLSPDEQRLYFVSDMPGGYGGTDVYYCDRLEGEWGEPVLLGPEVNTVGDESFPFIASDGTLFFASEGHLGYGGLDLFRARWADGKFTAAENLGTPVNSSRDDFAMVWNRDMEAGFFSSNRPGGLGFDDIYAFRYHPVEVLPEPLVLAGTVRNKATGDVLPHALVFLYDQASGEVHIRKSDKSGHYEYRPLPGHSLQIKSIKDLFAPDCMRVEVEETNSGGRRELADLMLDPYALDKRIILKNIYYDLDQWDIRPDAALELDKVVKMMKEQPVHVELGSHTDSRASDAYNRELSQKRAESAVRYIVLQGVEAYRISAKGYGESQLVNACGNGVKCSEADHQANRRSEIKITGFDEKATPYQNRYNSFSDQDKIGITFFEPGFFEGCEKK